MRKINLCYFLFVGVLVSCTNTYDVCEMQRNETEDMSSRMAGDGVYDVLGFGYDITEDYLGENSTRLQVIDVKALIRDNGDRFYNPFIGTIDQKIVAGEDAQSFLQNVITDSNFKGSVAAMDIKKDAEGFFSGTLSAGFKSASKYSYSSKYSFAKAEVTKKQRKYFVDADVELLSRYLSSNFVSDLGKYSADQIVAKYGTHVLTNITVGGSYIAYYKSAIIEENTGTEKKQTVSAGAKYNMSKVGLDFDGTWSTTTITEANKKNSDWTCTIQCVGGTTSGTTITLAPNQGPTTTINIGAWSQSVDDTHSRLVDVDWNATYPIYDLVSDPVKKADLKLAVEKYINSKKIGTDIQSDTKDKINCRL